MVPLLDGLIIHKVDSKSNQNDKVITDPRSKLSHNSTHLKFVIEIFCRIFSVQSIFRILRFKS